MSNDKAEGRTTNPRDRKRRGVGSAFVLAERLSEAAGTLSSDQAELIRVNSGPARLRVKAAIRLRAAGYPRLSILLDGDNLHQSINEILDRYNLMISLKEIVIDENVFAILDKFINISVDLNSALISINPAVGVILDSQLKLDIERPTSLCEIAQGFASLSTAIGEMTASASKARRPSEFALAYLIPALKRAVIDMCDIRISSSKYSREFDLLVELAKAVNPHITVSNVESQFFEK